MIRVQVSRDHPNHGFAVQAILEDGTPMLLHILIEDACVHDGPAIVVTQQPDIDVIQPAHHGHPNPQDAICYFRDVAWAGGLVFKSVRKRVKASLGHIVYHTLSSLSVSNRLQNGEMA